MSFITESKLKSFRPSYGSYTKNNSRVLLEFRNESKFLKTKIFLSHKHDEVEQLEGAISFLKKHGVEVYVDWLDDGMPKTTSGITASRIKEKIKENDKFILLATEAAINSKWCNWELGLGDAAKYINNIAILPIKKDNSDFTGSEYLQIYPYITNLDVNGYINNSFKLAGAYVVYPDGKILLLTEWLRSK
ncbi:MULTISPECIES: toll/interleukin-1 receptor domain-containing protein [Empedobacter]|uniref:toll/interleukin-1 receptor domain-containing protein n=1 Tax=Empedobacter TaxID=59734 RepID=UPI0028B17C36|nr:toll/interleukin-1 receptor domain-containing protein [Empedobacter brevis]